MLSFVNFGWVTTVLGGSVGEIEDKVHLSPTVAEIGAELGKLNLFPMNWMTFYQTNRKKKKRESTFSQQVVFSFGIGLNIRQTILEETYKFWLKLNIFIFFNKLNVFENSYLSLLMSYQSPITLPCCHKL